jgi:gas vesicle protein
VRKATAANEETLRDMSARLDGLAASVDAQMEMLTSAAEEPREVKALSDLRRLTAANEKTLREVSERIEELIAEGLETAAPAPSPLPLKQLEGFESMVEELRDEMTQLRRRIGLRAKGSGGLGEEQIDRLVDTIVDRLQKVIEVVEEEPAPAPPPRRQRPPRKA